jgi:hypothetical protein
MNTMRLIAGCLIICLTSVNLLAEDTPVNELVRGALTAQPDRESIDIEVVRHIRRPMASEQEIQRRVELRVAEILNGFGSVPPSAEVSEARLRSQVEDSIRAAARLESDRAVRQHWLIDQSGPYRIDQIISDPSDEVRLYADKWESSYIVPGNRWAGEKLNYRIDHVQQRAFIDEGSVWKFEDWRDLGTASMAGRAVEVIRNIIANPASSQSMQAKKLLRLASIETDQTDASGRHVDKVVFTGPDNRKALEFFLDAKNAAICYQANSFGLDGNLARSVRCDRFELIAGTDDWYPRQAEFVYYQNGVIVKEEVVTVKRVSVNEQIAYERFTLDDAKAGWTVIDSRVLPPDIHIK